MYKQYKLLVYVPLAFSLLLGVGIFACYGIGRSHGRHTDEWPYISDTGVEGPERCLFTLVMVWSAFLGFGIIHCYYRYVIACDKQTGHNKAAWVAGVVACVGLTFVGLFQWDVLLVPHLIGAGVTVVGAVVYSWLVVVISWRQLVPHVHGKTIVVIRAVLAVLSTISTILFGVGLALSLEFTIPFRMMSIISEWVCIYSINLFILTLAFDFRNAARFNTEIVLKNSVKTRNPTSGPSQTAVVTVIV